MTYTTGVARRSLGQPDPVLHLTVVVAGQDTLWCTGGAAVAGINTMRHRRCPRCLALARRDLVENEVEPNEPTALDWFLQRSTR